MPLIDRLRVKQDSLKRKRQMLLTGLVSQIYSNDVHLLCLQALCSLKDFPPFLLKALLADGAPDQRVAPPLREQFAVPSKLRQALVQGHNASQQAAIAAALTRRQEGVTLIQVRPALDLPGPAVWAEALLWMLRYLV